MKKLFTFLFVLPLFLFMAGTANGAATDASGKWCMKIPEQVKTVEGIDVIIPAEFQTFNVSFDGSGGVHHVQTSQPSGQQLGTDGVYHFMETTPPYSGAYFDNSDGTYDFDPNATTGWFVTAGGVVAGISIEMTIHQYVYSDAADEITDGIIAVNVDFSSLFDVPPGSFVTTVDIFFSASHRDECPVSVTVQPPVAMAGTDQIVFDEVILDGSQSYDPDGIIESYHWILQHRESPSYDLTANGMIPTVSGLESGFYDVTLTVTDDDGLRATDTILVVAAGKCDRATIVIGGYDSGVIDSHYYGILISDYIGYCAMITKKNGQFVRAVSRFTRQLERHGVITRREKRAIIRCAVKADFH